MKIKKWFTTLPFPYFLTHEKNKVDISKIKISKSGEVVLKTEEEQRKSNELSNNLTKAIKLLKRFVELENCTLDYDDIKKAEQFLSEVENV